MMPQSYISALASFITLACLVVAIEGSIDAQDKITFDDHVKPILRQRCASCHNSDKKSAGLDITNYTNLMMGGAGGAAVEPGDAKESYLYSVVTHAEEPVMPPNGTKIPENEIELLEKWITGGALESQSSVVRIAKPKFDMAAGANPNARPETAPLPPRLPLEPEHVTRRHSNANAIAVNPWAPIAAIGAGKQILLYNIKNLQFVGILPYPEGQIYKLKFSRNGSILIAGGGKNGASGNVVGWNIRTGERVFEIGDEIDAVMAADISTDHSKIALGGPSKMLRVYSTIDGSLIYEVKKHTEWITAIEFSPDGVLLATGDRNGGLHIWEAETGNEYLTLGGHSKQISAVAWRVDGNILATASEDASTKLWEMENGKQVKSWDAHVGGCTSIDFTRDGNLLTAGRDQQVKLWAQDGNLIRQFTGLSDIAISCAYCDETARVIGGDWGGQLRVWNGTDAAHLIDLTTNPPSLESRIAIADSRRKQVEQQIPSIEAEFNTLNNQLTEVDKVLATTSASLQTTQTALAATQQAMATADQQRESATTLIQQIQADVAAKSETLALLNEALTKANEAATRLPNDLEIQQVADLLSGKTNALDAEIKQHQTKQQQASAQHQVFSNQVTQLSTQLKQYQTTHDEMTKKVVQLAEQKKPLDDQFSVKQSQLEQQKAQLEQAIREVEKWQNEIAFSLKLGELNTKLEAAEQRYLVESDKDVEASQRLSAAQTEAEQAKTARSNALQAVESVKQEIDQAKNVGGRFLPFTGG